MAPPRRPWFRFYTEALTDPKVRRLTPPERWLWVAVLGAARQSSMPGWLLLTEGVPMEVDDLAELAGVTERCVDKGLEKMTKLRMVEFDHNVGAWMVRSWAERQFESDDTTERTRKHRSKNSDTPSMERSIVAPETEDRVREQIAVARPDDDDCAVAPKSSSSKVDPLCLQAAQIAFRDEPPGSIDFPDRWVKGAARKIQDERGDRIPLLRRQGRDDGEIALLLSRRHDADDALEAGWLSENLGAP